MYGLEVRTSSVLFVHKLAGTHGLLALRRDGKMEEIRENLRARRLGELELMKESDTHGAFHGLFAHFMKDNLSPGRLKAVGQLLTLF